MPEAIDHNPRDQRILRISEPTRESSPAPGCSPFSERLYLRRLSFKDRHEAGLHFFERSVVSAFVQHIRGRSKRADVGNTRSNRQRRRLDVIECGKLCPKLVMLLARIAFHTIAD